ncbi:bifunctional 4-hydroxy-2-oxoglutarate aldolase/2-dehydro-3-deoxy-phosphogluconate aldolase [Dyadobacter subterraneus]|uniref:Bifunctional 4-hydroxy-2-oxoglutarate aldolase/2-dehydro-3-deoxy-phosphogluconate aldolase n=1 Tax=Dyadobacter subterraneus TaxID=2773304 RepID=A0ABR9WAQ5_9BACT|nr:bifunctional 4-hydroxy-2-oxoglutarate aldolase/2-dehydro-3-deoxy-phosphogluconate aldolase [Dyadobacter subterraneus]MBE9462483.1 bifunctional 4-hydroxy-2-oxoglutarate aldolase/2-dehydro-3-deoxy-phosphogluconate aldolase [Dyadobacter subterraneus]
MSKDSFSNELFKKAPIVGIIRGLSLDEVKQILPIFRESGLTTIEITMNTPGAEDIIRYAREYESEGLNIGAGTVCTKDDLDNALEAGAQFIVTPIISKKVIKSSVKKGIPVFPGGFSPTELYNAWSYGAAMVKIYPATSLGPEYIKDLKAPLDKMKVLPTGGINLENMDSFLKAGADGLGIGGQLFDKQLIKKQDWAGLKLHFLKFVNKLNSHR